MEKTSHGKTDLLQVGRKKEKKKSRNCGSGLICLISHPADFILPTGKKGRAACLPLHPTHVSEKAKAELWLPPKGPSQARSNFCRNQ